MITKAGCAGYSKVRLGIFRMESFEAHTMGWKQITGISRLRKRSTRQSGWESLSNKVWAICIMLHRLGWLNTVEQKPWLCIPFENTGI